MREFQVASSVRGVGKRLFGGDESPQSPVREEELGDRVGAAAAGRFADGPVRTSPARRKVESLIGAAAADDFESPPTAPPAPNFSAMLHSAIPPRIDFNAFARPALPPFRGAVPEAGAFEVKAHAELQQIRGTSARKVYAPPPTPMKGGRSTGLISPLERREKAVREAVAHGVVPFTIESGSGTRYRITSLRELGQHNQQSGQVHLGGRNASVFLCDVEGKGLCVLKLFKEELAKNPKKLAQFVGNQLALYAKSMRDEVLKELVAPHYNLDAHVSRVAGLSRSAMLSYVEQNLDGFTLARYIPDSFPVEFDPNHPAWMAARAILAKAGVDPECATLTSETGIVHDCRRSNMRGRFIVDLYEYGQEQLSRTELARSFSDDPAVQEYLLSGASLPEAKAGEDR